MNKFHEHQRILENKGNKIEVRNNNQKQHQHKKINFLNIQQTTEQI